MRGKFRQIATFDHINLINSTTIFKLQLHKNMVQKRKFYGFSQNWNKNQIAEFLINIFRIPVGIWTFRLFLLIAGILPLLKFSIEVPLT